MGLKLVGSQAITTSSGGGPNSSKVALNSVVNDPSDWCDAVNSVITIRVTGWYLMCCGVEFASGSPSLQNAGVSYGPAVNDVWQRVHDTWGPPWSNPNLNASFSDILYYTSGQNVSLRCNQWSGSTGSTHNLIGDSSRTYLKLALML